MDRHKGSPNGYVKQTLPCQDRRTEDVFSPLTPRNNLNCNNGDYTPSPPRKSSPSHRHKPPSSHPNTQEALSQHDPGEQEHKGSAAAEEGRGVGGWDQPQSLQVQVAGEGPQQPERNHTAHQNSLCQPLITKETTALPGEEHAEN